MSYRIRERTLGCWVIEEMKSDDFVPTDYNDYRSHDEALKVLKAMIAGTLGVKYYDDQGEETTADAMAKGTVR